ncbi:2-C-methyl-D-erythritol 4-phosphate cytidylyltransferase [Microbacterium halotolerans]|uniref:2-C-methyl-D-erythritol 4-phosphate cytidylyltransferase n=1 Tax=Microbacterium halotolerans TaxID=246613 RepID=UPI000E6ABF30|nr:2-C-methyl-D-erythritol 4-phosphate cytidylyltransferase [Microbacterium halotolerans]
MTELSSPRVAVIVVAAGSGTRLGAHVPKAFVGLDEHTMLRHALDGVFAVPEPCQVIVVAPADRTGEALTEAEQAAGGAVELVTVIAGGATRHASVQSGLKRVLPAVEIVLVHDAARALTPPEVFTRVIEKIRETGWGAMPILPVIDTIKRVDGERVSGAVDRSQLGAAQTPQGFRRDILEASYAAVSQEHTDDAAVVMEAGHPVVAVEGHAHSFKITTPADLERARTLVLSGDAGGVAGDPVPRRTATFGVVPAPRIGIGTDVHAYGGDGDLWLAGLEWPGERALSGHSDGDVVAHAIVDALLSAAGLGDIGAHFGVDRPEFAGAHGEAFLTETLRIIRAEGFDIGNVAVQFQASKPKFAPRRAEAERALSAALDGASVSVSATTADGLGFTAADGVQAFATALLIRR